MNQNLRLIAALDAATECLTAARDEMQTRYDATVIGSPVVKSVLDRIRRAFHGN